MPRIRRGPLAELPVEVTALVAVAFMVAVGFGVVAPAIPLFAAQFGVGKTASSAVISAFAATRLATAPFVGRLVNALGERIVLATGIGIVAASSALAGFAQSYWQLLTLRGVGGVGSIMFSVSSVSLLIRVTPDELRGRAQGVYAGGFLLGTIAGPALGFVAAWSLRAPFFLYAGTLLGAGAIGLGTLRHSTLAARRGDRATTVGLSTALRNRSYRAALAGTFAAQWAVIGVRSAIVPLFVVEALGLGAGWTYVAFFAVSVVSGFLLLPLGRYADGYGRRPVLIGGLVAGAAGLAVLPVWSNAGGLLLGMGLLGVAGAALSVAPGAMVGDVVGGRGGTVVAVFQMAGDAGSILGPLVAGWIADANGYGATFAVAAVIMLLPVGVVAAAPETRHRVPGVAPAESAVADGETIS